jgi:putative ABC transport system substrate-binding protein
MKRREFTGGLGGAAVVGPRGAWAQKARQRPLIGWLGGSSREIAVRNLNAFMQGLQEHGHADGKDIDIVYRWADGDLSRQPALAKDLVDLNPDVEATTTIPVVGALIVDPLRLGLAQSYNRPGRNVTGVLHSIESLPPKQVDLLLELIPHAATIGVLMNPGSPTHPSVVRDLESAFRNKPIKIVAVECGQPDGLQTAFDALKRARVDGLVVLSDIMFFTEAARIISLAATANLPAIHGFREHSEQGGLMSYGVDIPQNFRRAAYFVDRILKGEHAAELPIEITNKFELVINLKASKVLGLKIPDKLLFTADEVIE